ncbi:hypothetical protein EYR40_002090 [Pleurotus pulmonarius]|nr:hypothetical protein EYR36_011509 [Pleurotus pulmonarius]KAF4585253.1 hypothetical protein EYR40_002090 [Pleurotus pulmonarius]
MQHFAYAHHQLESERYERLSAMLYDRQGNTSSERRLALSRAHNAMEKDIRDRIFGKFDEGTQEKVRPHFFAILDDVEVSFEQNGVEGKDVTPIAPGLSFAILDPVSRDRISQGSREWCEPVYDIADMVTLAKCLDGAIVGLNCLCQAGHLPILPSRYDGPADKVSYNFYHDLESLVWVYVWFLFDHVPIVPPVTHKGGQEAAKSVQASVPASLPANQGFQKLLNLSRLLPLVGLLPQMTLQGWI